MPVFLTCNCRGQLFWHHLVPGIRCDFAIGCRCSSSKCFGSIKEVVEKNEEVTSLQHFAHTGSSKSSKLDTYTIYDFFFTFFVFFCRCLLTLFEFFIFFLLEKAQRNTWLYFLSLSCTWPKMQVILRRQEPPLSMDACNWKITRDTFFTNCAIHF